MIILLSPSKSMDMTAAPVAAETSQPAFLGKSSILVSALRRMSVRQMMEFMAISEPLAELNRQRYQEWSPPFTADNAKPALLAFSGEVYEGLDAATFLKRDLLSACKQLRILSGLYGLLRPLDLIQPYRLEMGRPLRTPGAPSLYHFWRDAITDALNAEKGDLLVNLASQEYFKAIEPRNLGKTVVTPEFREERNGSCRVISFHAKRARGLMARYLIQNGIQDADGLLAYSEEGYAFNPGLSTPAKPVFTRPGA